MRRFDYVALQTTTLLPKMGGVTKADWVARPIRARAGGSPVLPIMGAGITEVVTEQI